MLRGCDGNTQAVCGTLSRKCNTQTTDSIAIPGSTSLPAFFSGEQKLKTGSFPAVLN